MQKQGWKKKKKHLKQNCDRRLQTLGSCTNFGNSLRLLMTASSLRLTIIKHRAVLKATKIPILLNLFQVYYLLFYTYLLFLFREIFRSLITGIFPGTNKHQLRQSSMFSRTVDFNKMHVRSKCSCLKPSISQNNRKACA